MSTLTAQRNRALPADPRPRRHLGARLAGAGLVLAVAALHVVDQGGFPGDKEPRYVGVGYYILEAAAVIAVIMLMAGPLRRISFAWLLALGVALGPLAGYVLSRGPGLPAYTDDRKNWTEPIGLASLALEGFLLVLALTVMVRTRRATR